MVRPGDHANHVWGDQADKTDGAADGDTNTDESGDGNHDDEFDASYVDTDVSRLVLPDGEGIKFTAVQEDDRAKQDQADEQDQGVAIMAA